jgi:hypothetical protein
MQTRDTMRERAQLEAARRSTRSAAPTPALARLKARSHGHAPHAPARSTETLLEGTGPLQKPLVR